MSYQGISVRQPPDPNEWMVAARARNKIAKEKAKTPLRQVALPAGTSVPGVARVQPGAAKGTPAPIVVTKRPDPTRSLSPSRQPAPGNNAPSSSSSSNGSSAGSDDSLPRKRIQSFSTMVNEITGGHAGELYIFGICGIERRKAALDTDTLIAMYKFNVSQSGQKWTIFRRYKQIKELDSSLKKKGLLAMSDKTLPTKHNFDNPKSEDENTRMSELQAYLEGLMSIEAIKNSTNIANFFEPINMGDTKRS